MEKLTKEQVIEKLQDLAKAPNEAIEGLDAQLKEGYKKISEIAEMKCHELIKNGESERFAKLCKQEEYIDKEIQRLNGEMAARMSEYFAYKRAITLIKHNL